MKSDICKSCHILVAEYVPGGSVDQWVKKNDDISEAQWKYLIFSMLWTLVILQEKYLFMHNDFHYGNILIDTSIDPKDKIILKYHLGSGQDETIFHIRNVGIMPKIWDLEFSNAYSNISGGSANEFGRNDENIPNEFNPYYDAHLFLTSLLELDKLSPNARQWILENYPKEVIPEIYSDYDSESCSGSEMSVDSSTTSSMFYCTDEESIESRKSLQTSVCDDESDSSQESSVDQTRTDYLLGDRLLNGAEKLVSLPTPRSLLNSKFFDEYRDSKVSKANKFNVTFKWNGVSR